MAMAATEIDRNGDIPELEFKSSPDNSMDGSQDLYSCDVGTPALTMETSTQASSTASLNVDINDESDNDLQDSLKIEENSIPSIIEEIYPVDGPCIQCEIEQFCSFQFKDNGETLYVCNEPCIKAYQAEHPGKYTISRKKYIIVEITPKTLLCSECEQKKKCYFYHNKDGKYTYYCSPNCLEVMMADKKDKYAFKLKSGTICIDQIRPKEGQCLICEKVKPCEFSLVRYGEPRLLCERTCIKILSRRECGRYYIMKLSVSNAIDENLDEGYKIQEKTTSMFQREQSFHRRCSQCTLILMIDENVLTWEAMDFCDEICLERFQNGIGYTCAKCNTPVQHTSLGKYCVRFGYDIRQFCNSSCLDEFKKGLKICCYCQRDISATAQVFLAPVGDKGQFKNFCSQSCVEKFDQMSKNPVPQPVWAKCAVCSLEKATTIEMEVSETASQRICSDPCFAAYKFANNIVPDQCKLCKKYFERNPTKSFTTYDDSNPNCFCSLSCMTIHIYHTRFIVSCDRCKSKKYNFDMIKRMDDDQAVMMCSLHCLSLFQESEDAMSSSNVVPPTLVPPVPPVEQGRADVMELAAEQLITLTKSLKRRVTTQSSKQEEHQRNESAKKVRFVIRESPRSRRRTETQSSSSRSDSPPSSQSRPVSGIARPVESSASPVTNSSENSNAPRTRRTRPSHSPPSAQIDIADIVNYGSEEDSDSEDNEENCSYVSIPRTARLHYQDLDEEEEFAVKSEPVYEWPPPHIRTPKSSPSALSDHSQMPLDKWHFEWRPLPLPPVPPTTRRETFAHRDTDCGPRATYQTPYEAFTSIWSLDVMELIARETNRYAREMAAAMLAGSMRPGSSIGFWKDTTTDELYVYFAVILATGITVKSRMEEYWSTDRAFFSTPLFSSAMSLDRFRILSKCLHFVDNSAIQKRHMTRSQAKLNKIQPIIDHLNSKFSELYKLSQNIALDQSLTQCRGWLDHRFNNHKSATVGIKTYKICECNSGYLWRIGVHAGHDAAAEEESPVSVIIPSLVLRLLKVLEGQGYTVWMDNYYNSPGFARELKSRGFDCVGTLRTNRSYVPEELAALTKQNMVPGEIVGCTSGDVDCVVWRDKNRVALVSTYHGLATWECNGVKKPTVARDYNSFMGSLDRRDQMLAMYPIENRGRVWYKKLFGRLLNASVLNAHIMHRKSNPTVSHRDFRMELCTQLLSEHSLVQTTGHFPAEYAHHNGNRGKKTEPLRRRCNVCKKRTKTYCEGCNLTLCLYDCFKRHHLEH